MKEAGSLLNRATTAASGSLAAAGDVTGATSQAQTFTNGIALDTIAEVTGGGGVTIDGAKLKDGGAIFADGASIEVDTVNEATAAAGVTIDGAKLKDGGAIFADGASIEVDTVNEATAAAGVTLDSVLIKDARVVLNETAAPDAPAADKAILYIDGGGAGGKSRLMARFQSGDPVVVALEA